MNQKLLCYLLLPLVLTFDLSLASDFKSIHQTQIVPPNKILIVSIEVDAGKVTIDKNSSASQINIVGDVNEKFDDLEIGFDERHNEFSLILDRKKWLKNIYDDDVSKLEISLPENVKIEFTSKIKAGEIVHNLGGLQLISFELHNFAGEVTVEFAEPNKIEMEYLDIDVKIGETRLKRLGNANFSDANINGGIGEMQIDLSGENLNSSRVNIDLDIGSSKIDLPGNVGIKLRSSTMGFLTDSNIDRSFEKRGRYYFSSNYDKAVKTMYVSINTGIGELKVDLR